MEASDVTINLANKTVCVVGEGRQCVHMLTQLGERVVVVVYSGKVFFPDRINKQGLNGPSPPYLLVLNLDLMSKFGFSQQFVASDLGI